MSSTQIAVIKLSLEITFSYSVNMGRRQYCNGRQRITDSLLLVTMGRRFSRVVIHGTNVQSLLLCWTNTVLKPCEFYCAIWWILVILDKLGLLYQLISCLIYAKCCVGKTYNILRYRHDIKATLCCYNYLHFLEVQRVSTVFVIIPTVNDILVICHVSLCTGLHYKVVVVSL